MQEAMAPEPVPEETMEPIKEIIVVGAGKFDGPPRSMIEMR
jgi:hypothetical protein